MILKLNRELICDITVHRETEGATYAVIRPDGTSRIFGCRAYLFKDVAKLVRAAVTQPLNREEKQRRSAEAQFEEKSFLPGEYRIHRVLG
jgi:hypothetical protein